MNKLGLLLTAFITFPIWATAQRVYEDDSSITIVGVNVVATFTNEDCGPVMSLDFGVELKPYHYVLMKGQNSTFKCINQGGEKNFRIPFNYFPELIHGGLSTNVGFMLEKWGIYKFDLMGGLFAVKAGTVDLPTLEQIVSRVKAK